MYFMCQQHKHTVVIHEEIICPFCSADQKLKEIELTFNEIEKAQAAMEKNLEELLGEEKADEVISSIELKSKEPQAKESSQDSLNTNEGIDP